MRSEPSICLLGQCQESLIRLLLQSRRNVKLWSTGQGPALIWFRGHERVQDDTGTTCHGTRTRYGHLLFICVLRSGSPAVDCSEVQSKHDPLLAALLVAWQHFS